ncbi:MAG: S8 family serine peptidase [Actinomycetia bacterium]|nr:S8 family serine peptidase [Actinomycetes bacterium]
MVEDDYFRKRDFLEDLIYSGFDRGTPKRGDAATSYARVFRRFTQDSPVMPDVWIQFGLEPFKRQDLLLTPLFDRSPGVLADSFRKSLQAQQTNKSERQRQFETLLAARDDEADEEADIAYNQTTVVARLWLYELVQVILPHTAWFWEMLSKDEDPEQHHPLSMLRDDTRRRELEQHLLMALGDRTYDAERLYATANLAWMARVLGTISLATEKLAVTTDELEARSKNNEELVQALFELLDDAEFDENKEIPEPSLHSVNRNRKTITTMFRSIPTVKADAAQQLFDVRGGQITWAILDSGIDATHYAFRKRNEKGEALETPFEKREAKRSKSVVFDNNTRVVRTFDFTRIRPLVSELLDDQVDNVLDAAEAAGLVEDVDRDDVRSELEDLKRSLLAGRMVDWQLLAPLLEIRHEPDKDNGMRVYRPPRSHHGTHVAGILAADWRHNDDDDDMLPLPSKRDDRPNRRMGMCPEVQLYDLRVVNSKGVGDEFAIMAALQFVRSLNASRDYVEVHGVNVSLSLVHEVSNYACGRTPICIECDRLVGAGTVVVASAGNRGRARYLTRFGDEEAYSNISITDPGNAESVITVGATHSSKPHNYGVSYFSSRGPTGDGRLKPDLVAPGEKIVSTIPGNREEHQDGTSMAAPHVSGAAALLMSRNRELIGNPLKIKQILCDTATDLGRERYFQGAGLLDILRALQSV